MLLNTARVPWVLLRDVVSADDTLLTSFNYSNWPSSNTVVLRDPPLHDANGVFIAFHGTAAANKDCLYNLYGRTRQNGPIQLLLTGIVTLGTQACTTSPIDGSTAIANGLWADTITATGGLLSGLVEILDSGNNRICMLKFDTMHLEDLYMEFDLDGGSDALTTVYAIITGY